MTSSWFFLFISLRILSCILRNCWNLILPPLKALKLNPLSLGKAFWVHFVSCPIAASSSCSLWKRLSSSCLQWKHFSIILTHVSISRHVPEDASCLTWNYCNVPFRQENGQQFLFTPVQFCSAWPSVQPLPNLHCTAHTMACTCNVLWNQCLVLSIPSERFTACPLWTRCKQFLYLLTAEHCCPV